MDFLQNTVEHLRGLPQKETMNFRAPAMVFGIGPGLFLLKGWGASWLGPLMGLWKGFQNHSK